MADSSSAAAAATPVRSHRAFPFQLIPGSEQVSSGTASFEVSPDEVRHVEVIGIPPWGSAAQEPSRSVRDLRSAFDQASGPVIPKVTLVNQHPLRTPSIASNASSGPTSVCNMVIPRMAPSPAHPPLGICPGCADQGIKGMECPRCEGYVYSQLPLPPPSYALREEQLRVAELAQMNRQALQGATSQCPASGTEVAAAAAAAAAAAVPLISDFDPFEPRRDP